MSLIRLAEPGRGERFWIGQRSWTMGAGQGFAVWYDGVRRKRLPLGIDVEARGVDRDQVFLDVVRPAHAWASEFNTVIRARVARDAENPVHYYDARRAEVRELPRDAPIDLGDGDILMMGRGWDHAFKVRLHRRPIRYDAFGWADVNTAITRSLRMTFYDPDSLRMRAARGELPIIDLRHAAARYLNVSVFELRGFELSVDPPAYAHDLYNRHLAFWRGYVPVFLILPQLEERPRVQNRRRFAGWPAGLIPAPNVE